MIKNIIVILLLLLNIFLISPAQDISNSEALDFFNKYQTYANTYNPELINMYSPNAKIIRQVVKPNKTTQNISVPAERYFKELKLGQKTARIRKYTNKYQNIQISQVPNGIKISAQRQPAKEKYWLNMYQIIQKDGDKLQIVEEMMQTKVQMFLFMKK